MADHVPPKLAVSSVVGYIKGKSAIHIARHFMKRERNYAGRYSGHEGISWIGGAGYQNDQAVYCRSRKRGPKVRPAGDALD